jgi:glucose/arabinose dehydrogenase
VDVARRDLPVRVRRPRALPVLTAVALLLAACTGAAPSSPVEVAPPSAELDDRDGDTAPPDPTGAPSAPGAAPGLPEAPVQLPGLTLRELVVVDAPIDTTVLDDGTLLLAQRAGTVSVLDVDRGTIGPPLLDVRERTTTTGERGLLSIAVRPDGTELFVSMTDAEGGTLVEAYPLDGSEVTGAPRRIYALPQPYRNHNGGQILFAPDGTLLLALGDGGGADDPLGAGQDLSTPLGSIVRLDVSGSGAGRAPSDNPFVGTADAAPEILAYGLRNPWRVHLDGPRGEVWIADVGQGRVEEINRVTLDELRAANFGWALREGDEPFEGGIEPNDHVPPLHTYRHGPGCSVTGGVVYRGAALPWLVGAYVFSDYCDGELRALFLDPAGAPDEADRAVISIPLGVRADRIVAFGTDRQGELLIMDLDGPVLRLEPTT